jgi:hypothetical protein
LIKDPAVLAGLILARTDEEFAVRWLAAEGLVALWLLQALTQNAGGKVNSAA